MILDSSPQLNFFFVQRKTHKEGIERVKDYNKIEGKVRVFITLSRYGFVGMCYCQIRYRDNFLRWMFRFNKNTYLIARGNI